MKKERKRFHLFDKLEELFKNGFNLTDVEDAGQNEFVFEFTKPASNELFDEQVIIAVHSSAYEVIKWKWEKMLMEAND